VDNKRESIELAADAEQVKLSQKRVMSTMIFLGLSLAILVMALVVAYRRTNNHAKTAFRQISSIELVIPGKPQMLAISGDGKYIAYITDNLEKPILGIRALADDTANEIVTPAGMTFIGISFSSDGKSIFYVARPKDELEAGLYQAPVGEGAVKEIMSGIDSPVSFSPNGQYFTFVREDRLKGETALIITKLDGTDERKLITRKQPETLSLSGPAWSPDGRMIVCAAGSGETPMSILGVNPDDGSAQPLSNQAWQDLGQLAWLSDGSALLFGGRQTAADSMGEQKHQLYLLTYPKGELRRVTNDRYDYKGVSITADSNAVVSLRSGLGQSGNKAVLIKSVGTK